MASQVQVPYSALLRHQTSPDPSQKSEIHPISGSRLGARAKQVGDGNSGCQVWEDYLRKLQVLYF